MSGYRDAEYTILEKPHAGDCFAARRTDRDAYPWCYVPGHRGTPAVVHRDRRGQGRSRNYTFLVLLCLDPKCGARLLVWERAIIRCVLEQEATR